MDTQKTTPTSRVRLGIRVDCVTRTDRVSPFHRIRAIGGPGSDGMRWRLSEEAVITAIEHDRATFYIEWPAGHRLEIVMAHGLGKRYLKTDADGDLPERLMALPDCA